jgi:hypothetical protein
MFIATRQEQSRVKVPAETRIPVWYRSGHSNAFVLPTVITCSEAEIAQRCVIAGAAAHNVRLFVSPIPPISRSAARVDELRAGKQRAESTLGVTS